MKQKLRLALFATLAIVLVACAPQAVAPANPMVGTTAPDFTLDDALGGQTSLSDYAEQPVLLFFHMAVG